MTLGGKIEYLRIEAGYKTQGRAATRLTELVGGERIEAGKFSLWESDRKKIDRYTVAAISLLHPTDPHGCLAWLLGKLAAMPRIPVDRLAATREEIEEAWTTVRALKKARRAIAAADRRAGKGAKEPPTRKHGSG